MCMYTHLKYFLIALIYAQRLYLYVPFSLYSLFNNSFNSYFALFSDFITSFIYEY